jgi:putative intracellular protease/amidase
MSVVLIPLPSNDFDPTEAAVPWQFLSARGHDVRFATPDGRAANGDPRMVHGNGLGVWRSLLRADRNGRAAYAAMIASAAFRQPCSYDQIKLESINALILPGGHAPGMKSYLESKQLQSLVVDAFARQMPIGAICHGVVLASRSRRPGGRSVLYGRRTTALTRALELSGWALTVLWLGNYYRTYPITVQEEVTNALAAKSDFVVGPPAMLRDAPAHLDRGFVVRDGNYLSARWPGYAHRFAHAFANMIEAG